MDFLLDTTTLSHLLKNDERVSARLDGLGEGDRIYTSVITEGELLFGAERAAPARRQQLLRTIIPFLDRLAEVLPVTRSVASKYAEFKGDLTAQGRIIPVNDLWIAATAAAGDFTLVAQDEHFSRIEGLLLEDWSEGRS